MIDGETGRTKVRLVNIRSTRYAIARRYMIRLRQDDFEDSEELAKLASTARLAPAEFKQEFEYMTAFEPPPLEMDEQGERIAAPD
jgi:6-phosphofructokinase 1